MQYNTIQYNTIQYNTIQCNAMQCNTIQYNTIQCNLSILFLCDGPVQHARLVLVELATPLQFQWIPLQGQALRKHSKFRQQQLLFLRTANVNRTLIITVRSISYWISEISLFCQIKITQEDTKKTIVSDMMKYSDFFPLACGLRFRWHAMQAWSLRLHYKGGVFVPWAHRGVSGGVARASLSKLPG